MVDDMSFERVMEDKIERKLPELSNIDEKDFKRIIEERELTLLENEIALLDETELGLNLNELDERKLNFLFNYTDSEMINSYTGKKTKNDIVNSFIMSFDNGDTISRTVWYVSKSIDDKGLENTVVKIADFPLYRKWKLRAVKYFNDNKLNDYVGNMQTLVEGKLDRAEVLKEAIFSDSISDNVSEKTKLDSRKHMIDILGLKKPTGSNQINIFHQGGGRELVESIEGLANERIEIIDAEIDDDIL